VSKSATVAATVVMTSAVQGEQAQIDIGPYYTANINVLPNVSSSSPGQWLTPVGITAPSTNVSMANSNISPLPIYLVVAPLQSTSGANISLAGASSDVGVQVSSTNPSFIPALSSTSGGDGPVFGPPVVWILAPITTSLEIGWV